MRRTISLLMLLSLCAACSRTAAQQSRQPAPTDVVASVGSTSITLAEVDERALQQSASTFGSMRLAQALYEARQSAITAIVDDLLMQQDAKTRGVELSALVDQEI